MVQLKIMRNRSREASLLEYTWNYVALMLGHREAKLHTVGTKICLPLNYLLLHIYMNIHGYLETKPTNPIWLQIS